MRKGFCCLFVVGLCLVSSGIGRAAEPKVERHVLVFGAKGKFAG